MNAAMNAADARINADTDAESSFALSVIVPAYKEAARLPRTLDAASVYLEARRKKWGEEWELIVVDDGSPDETATAARTWAKSQTPDISARVRVLRYEQNRGKGHAVRYGVLHASPKSTHLLYMDADLATPIAEIEKLRAALSPQNLVAIGSRPLAESRLTVRQPLWREVLGRWFNRVVQIAATPGIKDTQCGFKLLTAPVARAIFSRCVLDGFSFDVEVLFVARKLGFGIKEVPVVWAHQEGAAAFATKSAYLRHGLQMVADLFRIRAKHRAVAPAPAALSSAPPRAA